MFLSSSVNECHTVPLTRKGCPTNSSTFLVPSWTTSSEIYFPNCSPAYIWPVIKPGMLLFCLIFETVHDSHLFLYLTSFCQINLDSSMSQLLDLHCKNFTNSSKPLCPSSSSPLQHGSAPRTTPAMPCSELCPVRAFSPVPPPPLTY